MECHSKSCEKVGTLRCSRCKKVFYCSQKCQKEDWKKTGTHRQSCCPFKEPVKQKDEKVTKICARDTCNNEGSLRCSRCKTTNYCSNECQEEDWPCHKKKSCTKKTIDDEIGALSNLENKDSFDGLRSL